MENKPKIDFIIVTWNNENEIRDCIKSIKNYINIPHKIIIVDNMSHDHTSEIIRNEFPDVKFIASKENLGFAKANNVGLRSSKSNYVCFLNPDTILIEDIITPSIQILEKDETIGIVGCKLLNYDRSFQESRFEFENISSAFREIFHLKRIRRKELQTLQDTSIKYEEVDWIIGAELVLRRKDALKINGFSTEYFMYSEDMDLSMKVNQWLQKKVCFLPDYSLIHLGGKSEEQNFNYKKQQKLIENKRLFVKKFLGQKYYKKYKLAISGFFKLRGHFVSLFYWKPDRKKVLNHSREINLILKDLK